MATTGYPVAQLADGTGCTAPTLRQVTKARWENTGVVCGLAVTGGTTLAYAVTAGVAVCSKGDSDGYTECYFAGGSTPAVAAADSTNPRIDSVWLTSHDATQGDADNAVTLGVTQGTPAATPTAPAIPTYATELMRMRMPAGATTTANATRVASVGFAIPYGASLGVLLDQTDTNNSYVTSEYTFASGTIHLPTDRLVTVRTTLTCAAIDGALPNGEGSMYVYLSLDGVDKRSFEYHTFPKNANSFFIEDSWQIPAGTHTISARQKPGVGNAYRYYSAGGWAGQRLQVVDAGVVR